MAQPRGSSPNPEVPLYDPPKIKELVAVVKTVSDWYTMGLKLGVSTQNLDGLKDIRGLDQQKTQMFKLWMDDLKGQGERPTWQHILDVLKGLDIKNPIQIIERRYKGEEKLIPPSNIIKHLTVVIIFAAGPNEVRPPPEARVRRLSGVPTMGELQCLRSKDGKTVKVIDTVAPDWVTVAHFFDINSSVIRQLEHDHRRVADACREMFQKRLDDDEFDEPLTWNMVIGVLQDCDLNVFAEELKTLLTKGAM